MVLISTRSVPRMLLAAVMTAPSGRYIFPSRSQFQHRNDDLPSALMLYGRRWRWMIFYLVFYFSPFPHLPRWVRSFLAWLFLDPACKKIYSAPRWRIPGKRSKGSRTARPQTNAPGDMRDCGLIKCYVPIPRGSFSVALSKPMEPIVDL